MNMSEFEDAYDDKPRIQGEAFETAISELPLRDPILVDIACSVADAVKAMNEHHTGCVLVHKKGKLAGIFTERDVIARVFSREGGRNLPVEAVMTADPETLGPDDGIAFALNKMSVGGYRHIPIVERDGQPIGVLSVRDVVDYLVDLFPQEVLNLPPSPDNAIARSLDGG